MYMKWFKFIIITFCIFLIPEIAARLIFGSIGTQLRLFYLPLLSLPYLVTAFIFSSNMDKSKKIKWMWILIGIYLAIMVLFIGVPLLGGRDNGWGILGFMILAIPGFIGVFFITILLSLIAKYEENTQTVVILCLFFLLLIIFLLQILGIIPRLYSF